MQSSDDLVTTLGAKVNLSDDRDDLVTTKSSPAGSVDLVQTMRRFNVQTWCRPVLVILGSSADRVGLGGAFMRGRGRARARRCAYTLARMRKERKKGLHGLHFESILGVLRSARGLHFGFNSGLHRAFTLVCLGVFGG